MSIARHHAEWLSLVEVSGPFLSMPVLMRVFPQGLEAHEAERFRLLRMAYEEWEDNEQAGRRQNPAIHGQWIRFVLRNLLELPDSCVAEGQAIPQTLQADMAQHSELLRPSIIIRNPDGGPDGGKPRLLIQTYPSTQELINKPVSGHAWKASPDTRMMELLHATGVRLGLVTNGEHWMLVDAPRDATTGFASWYGHLWLEEPITLRAFTSLFNTNRFFGVRDSDTLEGMLAESANNQQEVTDQLGYQVRKAVEVLVQSLDQADQDHGHQLLANVTEAELYEAALTVMMRLVFLFCAEERRLLLLGDSLYDDNYAVSTLWKQLRETADQHGEEILERRHDAWCRLLSTFRAVYGGVEHDKMRLPAYDGRLFNPDRFPFLEGRKKDTTWRTHPANPLPVNNRTVLHLLESLQFLQVRVPGGGPAEARRLSFRALGIEQIGHVYEGLLDHTAKRAPEPILGLDGTRDKEPEIPLSHLEELWAKGEDALLDFLREATGRSVSTLKKALRGEIDLTDFRRFEAACAGSSDGGLFDRIKPFIGLIRDDTFGHPVVVRRGSVYVTAGMDRRSSGTHYTPVDLTRPIVQHTLEPLVYVGPAEGKAENEWKLRSAGEILDLKICDMACGSGAFLVQACRYMSERLQEAWELAEKSLPKGIPGITPDGIASTGKASETIIPQDPKEREILAQRLIAQRCLYGVDINPLACEMAKLSLWLLTLAKNKPFTFLDHAIRCGDSLLGISDLRQLKNLSLNPNDRREWTFDEISLTKLVDEAIDLRSKIEAMTSKDVDDVETQARLMSECEQRVAFLKYAADMLIATELKPANASQKADYREHVAIQIGDYCRSEKPEEAIRAAASKQLAGRRTFHWPLEFPEIMVGRYGFDAFIGNPPFMGGQKIRGNLGERYRAYLVEQIANSQRGIADLCAYFFLRAVRSLRIGGQAGLLATNTIAQGDTREVGLEQLLGDGFSIPRAIQSRHWPGAATLEVAHVWLRRGPWNGSFVLDDLSVPGITAYLTSPRDVVGNPFSLKANEPKSFIGSYVLGMGFILEPSEARALLSKTPVNKKVIFPYINGEDLNARVDLTPTRWVINFFDWPLSRSADGKWMDSSEEERRLWLQSGHVPSDYPGPVAADFPDCLCLIESRVKAERLRNNDRAARQYWWRFLRPRSELYSTIADKERVLVRSRIANLHSVDWMPTGWVFNEKTVVFPNCDFGVLQSSIHEAWARCYSATLRTDMQYSPSDSLDTFPFPLTIPGRLASISNAYYDHRCNTIQSHAIGLTKIYNRFHDRGEKGEDIRKLRDLHVEMDMAVAGAYGWDDLKLSHGFHETKQGVRFTISESARREVLARLLKLNHERYAEEVAQGLHDKKKGKKHRQSKFSSESSGSLFE